MRRITGLNYLIFMLASLFTYLFSKIKVFAPQSKYVVVNEARPTPGDLIVSSKYLEIYAPQKNQRSDSHHFEYFINITLGVLCLRITQQPPMPVSLPWETEIQARRNGEDKSTPSRNRITRCGVLCVIHDNCQRPTSIAPR
jgi:hypothetical protein